MQAMRDLLRGSLGRSLRAIAVEDRLAAAWTVACGRTMAERGTVVAYEDEVVRIEVADALWMQQMISLRETLRRDLARISGLKVSGLEFVKRRAVRGARSTSTPADQK